MKDYSRLLGIWWSSALRTYFSSLRDRRLAVFRLVTALSSLKSNNDPPGFLRSIFSLLIAKQKLLPEEPLCCRIALFYTLHAGKETLDSISL